MISDADRREMAATMRAISVSGLRNLTLGEMLNSILTRGAPRPTTEMAILASLADLIDRPIYRPVIPNEMEGGVFCPQCGAEIGEYGVPNYCYNCGVAILGAEVVPHAQRRD